VEGVGEPGRGGQGHGGQEAGRSGGLVEGADGGGDGRVEAVALGEGDPQELGQLAHVEALGGGAAEGVDGLLGTRLEELGKLRGDRTGTHVRSVAAPAPAAYPSC
jgi:hypothetical protein